MPCQCTWQLVSVTVGKCLASSPSTQGMAGASHQCQALMPCVPRGQRRPRDSAVGCCHPASEQVRLCLMHGAGGAVPGGHGHLPALPGSPRLRPLPAAELRQAWHWPCPPTLQASGSCPHKQGVQRRRGPVPGLVFLRCTHPAAAEPRGGECPESAELSAWPPDGFLGTSTPSCAWRGHESCHSPRDVGIIPRGRQGPAPPQVPP